MITHIEKLETQLSEFSEKYQKYSNFLHALHSHFRKTMLKNHFDIFFSQRIEKIDSKIWTYWNFFWWKKTRDSDDKVKENKFLYRQLNVDNVNENDDVQSAINRNESKNKKKWREYREKRSQKNETSHEKIKKLKN